MSDALRSVRLHSGHTLMVWDAGTYSSGKARLRYALLTPLGPERRTELFQGADYGVSPMHAVDSDAALLALLFFLSLRPGDTDSDYFAEYTPAQLAWAQSSACEYLAADVSAAEEVGGCACGVIWTNVDDWDKHGGCADRPTVTEFQVIDHGEDGASYFPGCGVFGTRFESVATGCGDTGAEALEDALESMAQDDATVSPLQEREMRGYLDDPDKSAFASLDHSECAEDKHVCNEEWHHYVSVRYNVRPS